MTRKYNVKVNGENYEVEVELIDSENTNAAQTANPVRPAFNPASDRAPQAPAVSAVGENDIAVRAPMPGTVLRVNVKAGDAVKRGQSLLVLESMKMENEIGAPEDGTISIVRAGEGNTVSSGEVLIYYRK